MWYTSMSWNVKDNEQEKLKDEYDLNLRLKSVIIVINIFLKVFKF